MKHMTNLVLAAAAALILAGPAFAEAAKTDAPTATVSARGVDFSSQASVKPFYARLRAATLSVCETDLSCTRKVMVSAVKAANKPVLTAMYQGSAQDSRPLAGNDQ